MTVYFIGAGPGDPDLITVKGQRLIRQCPVILYAGSLVPQALLEGHQAGQVVNTAELDLEHGVCSWACSCLGGSSRPAMQDVPIPRS